ncbi:MAG: 2-oxoacid:acceptor oxidoreductase family protein [Candidatus Riflebacteria bacterium]|nr:2-oxoacid:acceptor oxidoreductase family protein [Candidatus Riflebacteria bacterium]
MSVSEIKIGGFGGQGVILTGLVIGQGAALYDDRYSTMTQAFGPEARGSSCSSQVIISDEKILYPYVSHPDVLVVMSQDAYNRFAPSMKHDAGSLLIYESDMVRLGELHGNARSVGIPATRLAEELGRSMVLNIVMVGFFTAVTKLVSPDAARRAVKDLVPRGTETLNLSAFDKGCQHGLEAA